MRQWPSELWQWQMPQISTTSAQSCSLRFVPDTFSISITWTQQTLFLGVHIVRYFTMWSQSPFQTAGEEGGRGWGQQCSFTSKEQAASSRIMCFVAQLCLTLHNPMNGSPPGSSVHEDSPGKNTGVGCHALLQGIFPTKGLNPGLPHCKQILYCLSHQGSPKILEWVAYSISRGGFLTQESNRVLLHCRQILYQLSYQWSPLPHHLISSRLLRRNKPVSGGTHSECTPDTYVAEYSKRP